MSRQMQQDREAIAGTLKHLAARNREVSDIMYGFAEVVPECDKVYKSLNAQADRLDAVANSLIAQANA